MSDHVNMSVDELTVGTLIGGNNRVPTPGNRYYLDPAYGSDGNDGTEKRPWKTFKTAYAAMQTLKNDQLYIYGAGSAVSLTATCTSSTGTYPEITKRMGSFIGTHWGPKMGMRSRLSQASAFTPMLKVSGYGNTFANLYFQHGYSTGDYAGVLVTADRNSFHNCHFTPTVTAECTTGYTGVVQVTGADQTFFQHCVFGSHSVSFDAAVPLIKIGAGNGITIFEDCDFFIRADNTSPFFVTVDNSSDTGWTIFKNCHFFCDVQASLAVAINFAGSSLGYVYLDPNCQFSNVTLISATNKDQYLKFATTFASTDDNVGLIALTPTL